MKQRNIISNALFSLTMIWKRDRFLFLLYIFNTFLSKIQPFILIIFPKVLLDTLENTPYDYKKTTWIILISVFITTIIVFLQRYTYGLTSIRFMTFRMEKKEQLSSKTMDIDFKYLEDPYILDAYSRAIHSCTSWNTGMEGMLRATTELLLSIISAVGYIYILVTLDWFICLGLIVTCIIYHFIQAKINEIDVKYREEVSTCTRKAQYYSDIMTEPGCGKEIRMFRINSFFLKKYKDVENNLIALRKSTLKEKRFLLAFSTFIDFVNVAVFFSYLIFKATTKEINAGSFVMYITTFTNFSTWFSEILSSISELIRTSKDTDDFRNIMDLPPIEDKNKVSIDTIDSIEFCNVWFKYENATEFTLKNISFTINKNESISLVGSNGSGKTTIVKLLCGFYFPTKGEILINNIPIQNLNRKSLYSQIAAIFQEINIFAFSIAANVSLCDQSRIDEKKVVNSLKRVNLQKLLTKSLYGVHTIIQKILDEDGIELSGGENQGIAISRAIYKDQTSMIIMDEPTSHLDALMESRIYDTYNKIRNNRISIFISHRLASAQFCDKVFFIDNGIILGMDTHEYLLNSNDAYKKMYNIQANYYNEEENNS